MAEWVGHSVEVLHRIYADCLEARMEPVLLVNTASGAGQWAG